MQGFSSFETEMELFRQSRLHEIYPKFIEYLKQYPGHVKSRDLEFRFSVSGAEIRELVKYARRQSVPLASSAQGYSYARNFSELEGTLRHLEERRDSLSYTINRLSTAWESTVPNVRHENEYNVDETDEINEFYAKNE